MMHTITNVCEDSITLESSGKRVKVSISLIHRTAVAIYAAFVHGIPKEACVPAVFDMVIDDVKDLISITAKLEDEQ